MVAAPYISESVQARCKELGVGYIDLNGTFALIHRDVYIDVVRPATAFKNQAQLMAWLTTGKLKPLISAVYPLAQVSRALNDLIERKAKGKVVLVTN